MNKEILNQIPSDEQRIASELNSVAEGMQLSPTFQWDLETQLMDKAKKQNQPKQGWYTNILTAVSWALVALGAVFLLSWTMRSLIPNLQPATVESPTPEMSFEAKVRVGNICAGPLALAHNFSVFMTNQDKTAFVSLDEQNAIGELRSFAWSPDGKQLAVVGNTTGTGNIYLTDSADHPLQPVIPNSELGYLMEVAWSPDGKQLAIWSAQNNTIVYVVNVDGTDLIERKLDLQLFATPQFSPDNSSMIFYGADSSSSGLFEVKLDGLLIRLVSPLVEDESGFAWSPDRSQLAYIEMDRNLGEAHLVTEEIATGNKSVLATLPIPKGSGSSIPESANLSWSADGKPLVFELGRSPIDRAIYLAHTDGTELIQLVHSAYAPTISADGKCLAYISNKQVFLLDLTGISLTSTTGTPVLLADLPVGQSIADFRLDKLQWRPGQP